MEAETSLRNCLSFIKSRYANDLTEYTGQDIDVILDILRHQYPSNESALEPDPESDHHKRHVIGAADPKWRRPADGVEVPRESGISTFARRGPGIRMGSDVQTEEDKEEEEGETGSRTLAENPLLIRLLFSQPSSGYETHSGAAALAQLPSAQTSGDPEHRIRVHSMHGQHSVGAPTVESTSPSTSAAFTRRRHRSRDHFRLSSSSSELAQSVAAWRYRRDAGSDPDYGGYDVKGRVDHASNKIKTKSKTKLLLKIAHILHYISIAILGVFVIQVSDV